MSMNIGLTGIKAANTDLNTISHNIANVSTTGFKFGRAEFGDLVDKNAMRGINGGLGVQTQTVNQIFQQGAVIQTGNGGGTGKLDLAITGNGFFKVQNVTTGDTPTLVEPPIYTRAGSFHVDKDLFIVNNQGQRLIGAAGALQAPADARIDNVATDGTISFVSTANPPVTPPPASIKVDIYGFPNVQGLKAVGDTNWQETATSGVAAVVASPNILGGYLESSNVDLSDQLVNMIIAQRNFQANAKTITTENAISETLINMR